VQRKGVVGFAEFLEQAVGQHGLGSGHGFLGRLGHEHQRALPLLLQAQQRLGRAQPAGHVHVVAAAMGDKALLAVVLGLGLARIGQAGFSSMGRASSSVRTMTVGPAPLR
jgi:hypothetical protein